MNDFKSQDKVIEALLSGKKVVNKYSGVIFFFKDGHIESGISIRPTADFSDFENYEIFLG